MLDRCQRCERVVKSELQSDGSYKFVDTPLLYLSYTNQFLCPRCYIKTKEQTEIVLWSRFKYGPNREPSCLK